MSSTYSPDLRIELIGTGDQAGVWGNTTNTNLGTLMENAVAGYTSVSIIASPQALTANDGALDEARFAAIALTTSTGANFTVCIPPNSKLYTFYNASSYTATISNSTVKNGITLSGGTTVAIPAGKTISVWSDGTNVAQQTDQLISPTMSSPTMTGTPVAPTATFGTNTTQLATTAFVQAALQALHPIGSIYTSTSSTNPGTAFGFGTWVAYGAGRVLIGNGGGFSAGATGGSADAIVVTHTHTATTGNQSADHTHSFSATTSSASLTGTFPTAANTGTGSYSGVFTQGSGYSGNGGEPQTNFPVSMNASHTHTVSGTTGTVSANHNHVITVDSAGASGTNANLQPYVVVYMWNRTA
jgi:hypothetical protein